MRSIPFTAATLALVLFAGCMSNDKDDEGPPATTTGPPPPPPPPPLTFSAPLAMDQSAGNINWGFEPSVALDPEHNVYLTAAKGAVIGAPPEGSWLWVSNDGGQTFRAVPIAEGQSVSNAPEGVEGHVDANGEGTAYFVDLTLASITVSRSTDGGRTWELRTPAAAATAGGDREWVAAGGGERVYVVWNQIPTGFWAYASADGGRTFPTQTQVAGGSARAGVPAVGPEGNLYLARGEAEGVALYTSRDGAATFSRALAWPAEGEVGWLFSTVTVDEGGTVYVSTVEAMNEGATRVRYAYSLDEGATFSPPAQVTRGGGIHAQQWGSAGPNGTFAVAYYVNDNATQGNPDTAAGDWHVEVSVSRNANAPNARFETARPTTDVVQRGIVCTQGTGCSEGRELGDYLGVDVGVDGRVHVTWTQADPGRQIYYAQSQTGALLL